MRKFMLTNCANANIIKMKVAQMRRKRGDFMYANLERAINESGMSWRSVAAAIGMPESTFRYKMKEGGISIEDAFTIKSRVLPKYDLNYLFEKTA